MKRAEVPRTGRKSTLALAVVLAVGPSTGLARLFAAPGELELRFVDAADSRPMVVRLRVLNVRDTPLPVRGAVGWKGWHAVDGKVVLRLPPGVYRFIAEHGHEYRDIQGHFEIQRDASDGQTIVMHRITSMSEQGWWSGDLCTTRKERELPLAGLAEGLNWAHRQTEATDEELRRLDASPPAGFVPVTKTFAYTARNVLHASPEGALGIYLSEREAKELRKASSRMATELLLAADRDGARHITAVDPASWELPLWIASGRLRSIMILGPHVTLDGSQVTGRGAYPADATRFLDPDREGRWGEYVYYQLLNTGLQLPPVAGSGSGLCSNWLGAHVTYVYHNGKPTLDQWWEALEAGRVQITNGPLLLPQVNGEYPGHVFRAPAGQTVTLQPALTLHTRAPVEYLEIVRDGRVAEAIPLSQWKNEGGRLPKLQFKRSGWMLIRAVVRDSQAYRVGMTGPYYVRIGDETPISRGATQFFQDWTTAYEERHRRSENRANPRFASFLQATQRYWKEKGQASNRE